MGSDVVTSCAFKIKGNNINKMRNDFKNFIKLFVNKFAKIIFYLILP